jgi:hypothetical protein
LLRQAPRGLLCMHGGPTCSAFRSLATRMESYAQTLKQGCGGDSVRETSSRGPISKLATFVDTARTRCTKRVRRGRPGACTRLPLRDPRPSAQSGCSAISSLRRPARCALVHSGHDVQLTAELSPHRAAEQERLRCDGAVTRRHATNRGQPVRGKELWFLLNFSLLIFATASIFCVQDGGLAQVSTTNCSPSSILPSFKMPNPANQRTRRSELLSPSKEDSAAVLDNLAG